MATTGASASNITEQYVREAPDIEAYKLGLMQSAQKLASAPPALPAYQVAGMTPEQVSALQRGMQGIGSYAPYLQSGASSLGAGTGTLAEASNVLRGADTRAQFGAAQQAYNQAQVPVEAMGNLSNLAGAGLGYLGAAGSDFDYAQQMAQQSAIQPGLQRGANMMAQGANQGAQALGQAQNVSNLGIGAMFGAAGRAEQAAQLNNAPLVMAGRMGPAQQVRTQSFAAPGASEAYMSPYMQDVVAAQQREAIRQSNIQKTQQQAAATHAGAFGGGRQAIVEAERQRNLGTQLGDIQAAGLQSAYQQAQQQFNTEQQARLAAQQANQQAGLTVGAQNLSAQQQAALANQQALSQYDIQGAQLGMQAANALQQAGLGSLSSAQQMGALGLQGAGLTQAAGQGQISAAGQQGQLQQNAASLYGQMAGQQAGLAGQYANIAGQQANILGQQSQLQQQIGQGIGNLASQQFGVGQQLAQGLGSLGTQLGNLGVQQAALGQTAQQLGQNDVNFMYNLGSQQQKQSQAELDALRATQMQNAMQPYQQLAFQSDIYKGAPSTQMAVTQQQTAAPSPFQQIAGLGTGIAATAAAANKLF